VDDDAIDTAEPEGVDLSREAGQGDEFGGEGRMVIDPVSVLFEQLRRSQGWAAPNPEDSPAPGAEPPETAPSGPAGESEPEPPSPPADPGPEPSPDAPLSPPAAE
jgi:hypothetical protein